MKKALFVLFSTVLAAGCTHERFVTDSKHPEIVISAAGSVSWRGEPCTPDDLPELLEDSQYPKESTVNIRIEDGLADLRVPRYVMGLLARNGYRRTILQRERKAYSEAGGKKKQPAPQPAAPKTKTIKYKN